MLATPQDRAAGCWPVASFLRSIGGNAPIFSWILLRTNNVVASSVMSHKNDGTWRQFCRHAAGPVQTVTANRAIFAVTLFSNGRCDVNFDATTAGLAHIVTAHDANFGVMVGAEVSRRQNAAMVV